MTTECRGCGAPIRWALTEKGKRIPLDLGAESRFVLESRPGDQPGAPPLARIRNAYTSHFATCPKADEFRRDR